MLRFSFYLLMLQKNFAYADPSILPNTHESFTIRYHLRFPYKSIKSTLIASSLHMCYSFHLDTRQDKYCIFILTGFIKKPIIMPFFACIKTITIRHHTYLNVGACLF